MLTLRQCIVCLLCKTSCFQARLGEDLDTKAQLEVHCILGGNNTDSLASELQAMVTISAAEPWKGGIRLFIGTAL